MQMQQLAYACFGVSSLLFTFGRNPTFFAAFCAGCLLTPLLVMPSSDGSLGPRQFDPDEWLGHFADPAVIIGGVLMLAAQVSLGGSKELGSGRSRAANW